jgi:hypothetical protein
MQNTLHMPSAWLAAAITAPLQTAYAHVTSTELRRTQWDNARPNG